MCSRNCWKMVLLLLPNEYHSILFLTNNENTWAIIRNNISNGYSVTSCESEINTAVKYSVFHRGCLEAIYNANKRGFLKMLCLILP